MIIDSHAHYAHKAFSGEFAYLAKEGAGFAVHRGNVGQLMAALEAQGIGLCIEPGITLEKFPEQVALAEALAPHIRLTVGLHPKHCAATPLRQRKLLRQYAREYPVVALGETGLEFHRNPKWWARWKQKMWFVHHIRLAHRLGLPLVLHVRGADEAALKLLRRHRKLLRGGVAHCFGGNYEIAMAYIELGYTLGIGGRLLQDNDMARDLEDVVRRVPLSALLLETDAPFILPELKELKIPGKQRKNLRNSSLILPDVLEKIAQLRQQPVEEVEQAIYENTLRVFGLEKGGVA